MIAACSCGVAFFQDLTAVAWIMARTASTSPPNVINVG